MPVQIPDSHTGVHAMITIENNVARPLTREADEFFGLLPGTNGTAATTRRELYAPGASWVRSDGRAAVGVTMVPSSTQVFRNPWR